jgi:hypothetical protein
VPTGYEQIVTSGTPGLRPDGTLPDDFAEEARQAWRNVAEALAAAGAQLTDIVSVRRAHGLHARLTGGRRRRTAHRIQGADHVFLTTPAAAAWAQSVADAPGLCCLRGGRPPRPPDKR